MGLQDEIAPPIKCPGCGTEMKVSIAKMRDENGVTCEGCGATVKVNLVGKSDEAIKKLANLDKRLHKRRKRR